ncbi:MAG: porphobilinogen synthase [Chitinophagaceae bacterium]|nr:MAG: porphobilinogen synthase [Chitinophagaceae bacterium]
MLQRPRRNRKSEVIRAMVRENILTPDNLVQPVFLEDGVNINRSISALPGQFRYSIDTALVKIESCIDSGINSFILFPSIEERLKDKQGSYSYQTDNFYLDCIRKIKERFPAACLISDVALDPYNIDGHDGIVENGEILNDETLEVLGMMAIAQAEAGIDIIGPSDMMDGRVAFIRNALDSKDFKNVSIMSYTAKYASAFYGPFREALDSAPKAGDKKTYQMDIANSAEALREATLDEAEGADFLMVKPALHYLDVISLLKKHSSLPIAAYHVSGEYAMLMAACNNGWLDFEKAMPETLLSIKRAGADVIITYFAHDFAERFKAAKE